MNDSGDVVVTAPDCYGYRDDVAYVLVYVENNRSPVWKLEATPPGGAPVADVTLGVTPAGFSETTALDGSLPQDQVIHVGLFGNLEGRRGQGNPLANADFTIGDLASKPVISGCGPTGD